MSRSGRILHPDKDGGADKSPSVGQVALLEPWFSNRTKSLVKSPKLYLADTGLLCTLLNIRSEEALADSPWAGAVWETFVFAQLRHRERRAGRAGSLFFWRDRTREVDFVVEAGGRLELFEAKRQEKSRAKRGEAKPVPPNNYIRPK